MFRRNVQARCAEVSVFLILLAGVAEAQGVAGSFEQLRSLVKPGDTVIVTDKAGRDIQGQIAALSSSSLELLVAGTRTNFTQADLDTISRRDSRWSGTLWGLVAGTTLGTLFEKGISENGYYDGSFTVLFGGIGSGIGFATDAMIKGRRIVFSAPSRSTTDGTRVSVLTDGKSVRVVLRF